MTIKSPLINVIRNGIMKVSKRVIRDFGEIENLQLSHNKIKFFSNNTISYIEKTISEHLKQSRPGWKIIIKDSKSLEENKKNEGMCWTLDPINGISNFNRGIPFFAIILGVKKNNETIASSIYDPIRDEFYFAEKGKGAFLNDRRIRVSSRNELLNSLISVDVDYDFFLKIFNKFNFQNFRLISCGALSIAWVCCGKLDCYIGENINLNIKTNGSLLLRESGGFFNEFFFNRQKSIIVANPSIHKTITKLIALKTN